MTTKPRPRYGIAEDSAPNPARCPYCKVQHEAATGLRVGDIEPNVPEPGDISICFACGELSVFADDLSLREPTVDEHIALGKSEAGHAARRMFNLLDRDRRRASAAKTAASVLSMTHLKPAR